MTSLNIILNLLVALNSPLHGSLTTAEAGIRNEFLRQINKVRASGCRCGGTRMPAVPPLTWNDLLEKSAQRHATDMYRRNYFSHTSLSGKTIKTRMEEAGYTMTGMRSYAIGENIAAGQRSVDEVMRSWLESPGHCKNIMSANFREIGVAEFNNYWVQDFGMRTPKETAQAGDQIMSVSSSSFSARLTNR